MADIINFPEFRKPPTREDIIRTFSRAVAKHLCCRCIDRSISFIPVEIFVDALFTTMLHDGHEYHDETLTMLLDDPTFLEDVEARYFLALGTPNG